MKLHRQERRYFAPTLSVIDYNGTPVVVPPTSWQASFDKGLTWITAVEHPDLTGQPAWLLRGPNFPGPGDSSTTITGTITIPGYTGPLVRLVDTPETAIVKTESISLTG